MGTFTVQQASELIAVALLDRSSVSSTSPGDLSRGWATKIADAIFRGDLAASLEGMKFYRQHPAAMLSVARCEIEEAALDDWLASIGSRVRLEDDTAPPMAAAPREVAPSHPDTCPAARPDDWTTDAQRIALEYKEKHRAADTFPTQMEVGRYVSDVMRATHIYGPSGSPLSPATIVRQAFGSGWWKANLGDAGIGKIGKFGKFGNAI